jgi:hypothetical protein
MCDRCGQQFKLKTLKTEIIKTKRYQLLVCNACWDPDQPQLQLGMYPIDDPQAVRNPRPDNTYLQAGLNTLGDPTGGSRVIQWGWNPIGGSRGFDDALTPNDLHMSIGAGTLTVTIT